MNRRQFLNTAALSGLSASGWFHHLARAGEGDPARRRSCILLWMNGGPSQMDTFDLKPGHENGGPYREIQTPVPGLRISEHLPKLARQARDLAIVRSMSTKEGDHARGSFYMRTGYLPQGPIQYPSLGSFVSKELAPADLPLPGFVSISPYRFFSPAAYGPGFLGPQYAPLLVGDFVGFNPQQNADYTASLRVQDLEAPADVSARQFQSRTGLLEDLNRDFGNDRPDHPPASHRTAYERALRLMRTNGKSAFELDEEPATLRDAYGRNVFGQGCLLARRLVERGVPFVEVTLGGIANNSLGWDTHTQNFPNVRRLSEVLDAGWGTLMEDLRQRGLLETTMIVWMGEFGRTPKINQAQGRDHYPNAWTTVLAGGGIKGGQAVGATSADGTTVEGKATSVPDFVATICRGLGLDPAKQNLSNVGRPIRLVDTGAQPLREILA